MKEIRRNNNPIKQHHVPQVYLRNFCNSNSAITVLDKHTQKVFSTGVQAVGAEKNFYTLDKMKDPYYWERVYATGIEPLMGNLLPAIISRTNPLVQNGSVIINHSEKKNLRLLW